LFQEALGWDLQSLLQSQLMRHLVLREEQSQGQYLESLR
jgi:hypothetical protein